MTTLIPLSPAIKTTDEPNKLDKSDTPSLTSVTASRARAHSSSTTSSASFSVPHALELAAPVVSRFESTSQWDAHLQAILDHYAPEGPVQHDCAVRVASLLWRLNRVVRYETEAIAAAYDAAEQDAADILASTDNPTPGETRDLAERALPRDVAALRQRLKDAQLAAEILFGLQQTPAQEVVPDEHARVALRFIADHCAGPNNPPTELPGLENHDHWTGSWLRQSMGKLVANRSLGDVIVATIAYAKKTATAAEQRIKAVEALAARLRRQRIVPQPPTAAQIRDCESHLTIALDLAIRQLETLQARRH